MEKKSAFEKMGDNDIKDVGGDGGGDDFVVVRKVAAIPISKAAMIVNKESISKGREGKSTTITTTTTDEDITMKSPPAPSELEKKSPSSATKKSPGRPPKKRAPTRATLTTTSKVAATPKSVTTPTKMSSARAAQEDDVEESSSESSDSSDSSQPRKRTAEDDFKSLMEYAAASATSPRRKVVRSFMDDAAATTTADTSAPAVTSSSLSPPPKKRGRGRPPKNISNKKTSQQQQQQVPNRDVENSVASLPSPKKRPRGRPPKKKSVTIKHKKMQSNNNSDDDDSDDSLNDGQPLPPPQIPRRGRGRPPKTKKNQIQNKKALKGGKEEDVVDEDSTSLPPAKKKRPRGRPPKKIAPKRQEADSRSSDGKSSLPTTPKKRRGRPPKKVINQDDNDNDDDDTHHSSSDDEDSDGSSPPRKRTAADELNAIIAYAAASASPRKERMLLQELSPLPNVPDDNKKHDYNEMNTSSIFPSDDSDNNTSPETAKKQCRKAASHKNVKQQQSQKSSFRRLSFEENPKKREDGKASSVHGGGHDSGQSPRRKSTGNLIDHASSKKKKAPPPPSSSLPLTTPSSTKKNKRVWPKLFLEQLFRILERSETTDPSWKEIISWTDNGTAFAIKNSPEFESTIMPTEFAKNGTMSNFVLNLKWYEFDRIGNGKYRHKHFTRPNKTRALQIPRRKTGDGPVKGWSSEFSNVVKPPESSTATTSGESSEKDDGGNVTKTDKEGDDSEDVKIQTITKGTSEEAEEKPADNSSTKPSDVLPVKDADNVQKEPEQVDEQQSKSTKTKNILKNKQDSAQDEVGVSSVAMGGEEEQDRMEMAKSPPSIFTAEDGKDKIQQSNTAIEDSETVLATAHKTVALKTDKPPPTAILESSPTIEKQKSQDLPESEDAKPAEFLLSATPADDNMCTTGGDGNENRNLEDGTEHAANANFDDDIKKSSNASGGQSGDDSEIASVATTSGSLVEDVAATKSNDCDDIQLTTQEKQQLPFPLKMWEMMNEAEANGWTETVSWMHDGAALKIIDTEDWYDKILPLYFERPIKAKSAIRNLQLHGFQKIKNEDGVYFHPLFSRDNREQCKQIYNKQNRKPPQDGDDTKDDVSSDAKPAENTRRHSVRRCTSTQRHDDEDNTGRWTDEEHRLFLKALETYRDGRWKEIAAMIKTRTVVQVRNHAQKYFEKIGTPIPTKYQLYISPNSSEENIVNKCDEEEGDSKIQADTTPSPRRVLPSRSSKVDVNYGAKSEKPKYTIRKEPEPEDDDMDGKDNLDVFFGRGGGANQKRQGSLYSKLIRRHFKEYHNVFQHEKRTFAEQKVITPLQKRGAKFWNPKNNGWVLAHPDLVRYKVMQALRDRQKTASILGYQDEEEELPSDETVAADRARGKTMRNEHEQQAATKLGSLKRSSPHRSTSNDDPPQKRAKTRSPSSLQDPVWSEKLEELKAYRAAMGNCNVPRGYSGNPQLAGWVKRQRELFMKYIDGKPSKMTAERIAELDKLDFDWDPRGLRKTNGTLNVQLPFSPQKDTSPHDLDDASSDSVEDIESSTDTDSKASEESIVDDEESKFDEAYRNIIVNDDSEFAQWRREQREISRTKRNNYCNGANTEIISDSPECTSGRGFVPISSPTRNPFPDPFPYESYDYYNQDWGAYMYDRMVSPDGSQGPTVTPYNFMHVLNSYRELPQQIPIDDVNRDLNAYDEKKRSNDDTNSRDWSEKFPELLEFKKKHGHCSVPSNFPQNPSLAAWVIDQRLQYKAKLEEKPSYMTEERVTALQQIGFVWNPVDAAWEDRLDDLREYKAANGHCNVPYRYPANMPLANWVKNQRRTYRLFIENKPSAMPMARIVKLNQLQFEWDCPKTIQTAEGDQKKASATSLMPTGASPTNRETSSRKSPKNGKKPPPLVPSVARPTNKETSSKKSPKNRKKQSEASLSVESYADDEVKKGLNRNEHDVFFGRGNKAGVKRLSLYRSLVLRHFEEYRVLLDQKGKRQFVETHIIQPIQKQGGNFYIRRNPKGGCIKRLWTLATSKEIAYKVMQALRDCSKETSPMPGSAASGLRDKECEDKGKEGSNLSSTPKSMKKFRTASKKTPTSSNKKSKPKPKLPKSSSWKEAYEVLVTFKKKYGEGYDAGALKTGSTRKFKKVGTGKGNKQQPSTTTSSSSRPKLQSKKAMMAAAKAAARASTTIKRKRYRGPKPTKLSTSASWSDARQGLVEFKTKYGHGYDFGTLNISSDYKRRINDDCEYF